MRSCRYRTVLTFAVQMEALRRYRTGGQQKGTVEHVTVNDGGQAIVGSLTLGGWMTRKIRDQPHEWEVRLSNSFALSRN